MTRQVWAWASGCYYFALRSMITAWTGTGAPPLSLIQAGAFLMPSEGFFSVQYLYCKLATVP
jgi:hypothetical protein